MHKELESHIRSLSDTHLVEYTRMDTYLPEAIQFAKDELARRNLGPERLAEIEKALDNRAKAEVEEERTAAASKPLAFEWRLWAFLYGLGNAVLGLFLMIPFTVWERYVVALLWDVGLPGLVLATVWLRLSKEGARHKIRDTCIFFFLGLLLAIFFAWMNIPPWTWLRSLTSFRSMLRR